MRNGFLVRNSSIFEEFLIPHEEFFPHLLP
jgi:hypothetical protein